MEPIDPVTDFINWVILLTVCDRFDSGPVDCSWPASLSSVPSSRAVWSWRNWSRAALQAGNLPGVALAAHPIKSSAGNVGAVQVQVLATQIEQSAKNAQAEVAPAQIDELERAFAEVVALLQAEKTKLQPKPG